MYNGNSDNNLFGDGWRDPGDDGQRAVYYLAFVLFGFLCVLGVPYGLYLAIHDKVVGFGLVLATVCSLLVAGIAALQIKESKNWGLSKMTPERVIAGGFILGFGLIGVGVSLMSGARHSIHNGHNTANILMLQLGFIGVGILLLIVFLIAGLIFAFAPMAKPKENLYGVLVIRWFGLDRQRSEVENHPCPWEDGLKPIVEVQLANGRTQCLEVPPGAYEQAQVVGRCAAIVVNGKVVEFRPQDSPAGGYHR